jgi:SSS family solute:Na+ symporter
MGPVRAVLEAGLQPMNFSALDWIIVIAYLTGSVALGIRAKKYVGNLAGYMVAGRRVNVSLGIATFVATEIGTVTFVYYGEIGYVAGFSGFIIGILAMTAYSMVGGSGFIIEELRRQGVMTIPEFYELRYSRNVRLVGGMLLFLGGVLNMGIFLKFDGIFLSEVMGFGPGAIALIMAVMLIIVIAYTILGGMFSVVITDYMQFVVLAAGMLVATIAAALCVSPARIGDAIASSLGSGGFDPFANPRFGWIFVVWILISSLASAALWQPGTSRALSSQNERVAKRVFFWTGLTFAGRAIVPMFWGAAALAYFGPGSESAAAMPKLIGRIVPTGFLGLFVAGLLAASMSTYSAYLLAWSSVLIRDVVGCMRKTDLGESLTVALTRVAAGLIGVFLLVFGLWYRIPDTAFQYLYLTGTMYVSGALGCVASGMYWRRANSAGAYASLVLGAITPAAFLILEKWRASIPGWLQFTTDVNTAGLLSFALAGLGMVAGSLLRQGTVPSRQTEETEGT